MKPFDLIEVNHTEEGWEPDTHKEYLIQYRWKKDKKSIFLVGSFSSVWFGYNFHWYWGASSLQLDTVHNHSNDIENFIGIWEVVRLPEPEAKGKQTNLITKEEMDI